MKESYNFAETETLQLGLRAVERHGVGVSRPPLEAHDGSTIVVDAGPGQKLRACLRGWAARWERERRRKTHWKRTRRNDIPATDVADYMRLTVRHRYRAFTSSAIESTNEVGARRAVQSTRTRDSARREATRRDLTARVISESPHGELASEISTPSIAVTRKMHVPWEESRHVWPGKLADQLAPIKALLRSH